MVATGRTVLLHELRERDGDDGVRARGGGVHQRRAHRPVGVAHVLHLLDLVVRGDRHLLDALHVRALLAVADLELLLRLRVEQIAQLPPNK